MLGALEINFESEGRHTRGEDYPDRMVTSKTFTAVARLSLNPDGVVCSAFFFDEAAYGVLYNNLEFYYNLEFQVVVRNLEIWVGLPNCQAGTNKCT